MLGIARLEFLRERRELLGARADARELALGDRAPGAAVVADVQLAEPGAHLAAVARRDQIALLGGEPVAARARRACR